MAQEPREVARSNWAAARQVRQNILSKIEDFRNGRDRSSPNYTSRFEEVEVLMKELRLACMQVIFHDFEYAAEKDVESILWQAHTFLNGEYRRILGRLGAQNQVVQKRKVDKLYRDFLKTSQSFYCGYIQRLSDRFYIAELYQAACDMPLGSSKNTVRGETPPPALRAVIISACYMTLVRLGDLARYRCQVSEKPSTSNFNIALTYYSLANMLDPDDGSSHHQMGVLYQLQSQQLEIMYHFHRSISIRKPYKLGPSNLERGFKSLENQSVSRRGVAKDPSETMKLWFLTLHASYYQGELFTAQSELEEEVLHRLELSVKTGGFDVVVLKMLLINIAAYGIALDKVNATWTMNGSRSCQFMLSFNVRTALILLRLLKSALLNVTGTANVVRHDIAAAESATVFSESLERLLPLCRIYIAWIYVSRADFVEYQEYLEPHVREVFRLLADVLTLLFPYVNANQETIECKYLLPEDIEAIGLKPLCDRKLPLFLNTEVLHGVNPPKRRKTMKPRKEVFGSHFSSPIEYIWRIRDIVCCGIYLAGSGKFPLAMSKTEDGVETWYYADETNTQDNLDEISMVQTLGKLKLNVFRASPTDDDDFPDGSNETLDGLSILEPGLDMNQGGSRPGFPETGEPQKEKAPEQCFAPDLSEDSEMVKMVDSLLATDDEEVNPRMLQSTETTPNMAKGISIGQSSRSQADTRYGVNPSTANILGGCAQASEQQSAAPLKEHIPSLPWGYFYNPPVMGGEAKPEASVPNVAIGSLGQISLAAQQAFERNPELANAHVTVRPFDRFFPSDKPSHYVQCPTTAAQRSVTSSPVAVASASAKSYATAQHNAALDNLRSTLAAQYGSGAATNPPSSGFAPQASGALAYGQTHTRSISGSPISTGTRGSPENSMLSNSKDNVTRGARNERRGLRVPSGASRNTRGAMGATDSTGRLATPRIPHDGLAGPKSPTGAAYGYQGPSPLASPFSPAGSTLALGAFDEQIPSGWGSVPGASNESLAFSHPSSLWTGTQNPRLAQTPGINCNGNIFNASTPYGRSGEVNNRDDPTHFRNRVNSIFGGESATSSTSYDRLILDSALVDRSNKPRQK